MSAQSPDTAVEMLLKDVGTRMRKARGELGIPRRVLSEKSGLSPRYIAQLESGEGNISIGLLKRVAIALDRPIEWFFGEEPAEETSEITRLFQAADSATRARVLDILRQGETASRASRICLVGMRGAGKSTLGQMLADRLGMPFVELNSEIETQAGMATGEIMELYGNEGYRRFEADALDNIIASSERLVVAVAGGIVSEQTTYDRLLSRFHAIWLKASATEHMERVRAQGDERPMAGHPQAMDQLKSILTSREALYAKAEALLDTSNTSVAQSLDDLAALVHARRFAG